MNDHLRGLVALMVVLSGIGGAVVVGPQVGGPVGDVAESANVVGEADAAVPLVAAGLAVAGGTAAGFVGGYIANRGSNSDQLNKTDALETHKEIFSRSAALHQQQETILSGFNNHLQDTESIAKMEGKNAYIRALNNGTPEASARTKAKNAVSDYYSDRQMTLVASWNTSMATVVNMHEVAEETPGLNGISFGAGATPTGTVRAIESNNQVNDGYTAHYVNETTETASLANGSSVTVKSINLRLANTKPQTVNIPDGSVTQGGPNDIEVTWEGFEVNQTPASSSMAKAIVFDEFEAQWSAVESQEDSVLAEMDTFVDNTYSAYQQGEINNSDLVDPYVLASQQSAGSDFQGWTAAQLTLLGTNSPESAVARRDSPESAVTMTGPPAGAKTSAGTASRVARATSSGEPS